MPNSALDQWLDLAPKPWPLQDGQKWHIYLGYGSVNRPWVLQLYDILRGLGYEVFLGQNVFAAGENIIQLVEEAINQSSSAVMVWSSQTGDSEWIKLEFELFSELAIQRSDSRLSSPCSTFGVCRPSRWTAVLRRFLGIHWIVRAERRLFELLYGLHGLG